ncbi:MULTISPECIES: hypothetical protein [unclassified Streptomyces]|uniref:hypothetical protein n=1 Tax=unclassified Streptomyces TaxID=2593676 RepID=UPI0033C1B456
MKHVTHIHPVDDKVEHDTSSGEASCVCGPAVRPVARDDGSMSYLIVHHSLDNREKTEGSGS